MNKYKVYIAVLVYKKDDIERCNKEFNTVLHKSYSLFQAFMRNAEERQPRLYLLRPVAFAICHLQMAKATGLTFTMS